MSEKPLILISNDDGITAPGIRALIEAVKPLGDLVIVAPDSPQSGMGHAVTISKPLRLDKTNIYGDIPAYQCSGTPADCVSLICWFRVSIMVPTPPSMCFTLEL
jgi:5'-nucleotidase